MKPCIDDKGNVLKGLFKKDDGSIVVNDPEGLRVAQLKRQNADKLVDEIESLKMRIDSIMKYIESNK